MQFFDQLACFFSGIEGLKRDVQRILDKFVPQYQELSKEAARAEIRCEMTSDKADCDQMNELQRKLINFGDQIAEAKEILAYIEKKCG